ncbi:MAG: T9SS type A sorting domain-containing protein [Lewinellaceae bacterium]|nr:T9SS type A sorting domain-containing protein [Lewinellaceae bacterium]
MEGCGTNSGGTFSTGFVTQFPYADESPALDTDCQENIASFDPNDKQGFPRGVHDEHFIPENQEITYHIRFQNTGTDTAFNIVILDTLSERLELATLRTGAASHPYTYNILGPGVIQFLFQNILLPDSNVNEAASHGFVQFSIRPKADLSKPSLIENAAAIYFDFNEPVITNRTWHTVGEIYLNLSNVVFQPGLELDVYPNPASTAATFFLKSPRPIDGRLLLFDSQGRLVQEKGFQSDVFDLPVTGLAPGLYFYRLESKGKVVAAGKMGVSR